jgi:DNA-binding response OmpR family regulator
MVLRAKIETVLKRYSSFSGNDYYKDNQYLFDFSDMQYKTNQKQIFLSNTEQRLLKILVINRGNIVVKERIIAYIWGNEGEFIEDNAVAVTIKRLRKKLEDKGSIKSVYGLGYMWESER